MCLQIIVLSRARSKAGSQWRRLGVGNKDQKREGGWWIRKNEMKDRRLPGELPAGPGRGGTP